MPGDDRGHLLIEGSRWQDVADTRCGGADHTEIVDEEQPVAAPEEETPVGPPVHNRPRRAVG